MADPTAASDEADGIYRWTVRVLYLVAFGLNAWVLFDQVRDSPEAMALRHSVADTLENFTAPIRGRMHFRRHVNRVIYEATEVVEGARKDG